MAVIPFHLSDRLDKTGVPPITDELAACIDALTDTAFWQLMLGDDIDTCHRDVELLCANIRFRWGQVRADINRAQL